MPGWNEFAGPEAGAVDRGRWRCLAVWLTALALNCAPCWAADGIDVRDARLHRGEAVVRLDADFGIALPPEIEELVDRGIAIHFSLQFELIRERRYWFNRTVVERSQEFRLTYHPITRSYRVSSGLLHQSFDTLDSALRTIGRVRAWEVVDAVAVNPNKRYRASLRLELDRTLLPRPFQLQVFATDDWTLDSGEHRWEFDPANEASQ